MDAEGAGDKVQKEKPYVRKRSANVTEEQKTLLLQFMEQNPRLICGRFTADFTYKDASILWQELASILNSCNGVKKDWKSWRKAWQDLRSRSKLKQSKINAGRRATGGGKECTISLSTTEEATLNLINPTSISGHTEISESTVVIQPETETNYEMDEAEYLDEGIEYLQEEWSRQDTCNTSVCNVANQFLSESEDKENTPVTTDNIDDHDTYSKPTQRKKSKSKADSPIQATQTLAEVARETFKMQNAYYEKKLKLKEEELEIKKSLVDAVRKCNPS